MKPITKKIDLFSPSLEYYVSLDTAILIIYFLSFWIILYVFLALVPPCLFSLFSMFKTGHNVSITFPKTYVTFYIFYKENVTFYIIFASQERITLKCSDT